MQIVREKKICWHSTNPPGSPLRTDNVLMCVYNVIIYLAEIGGVWRYISIIFLHVRMLQWCLYMFEKLFIYFLDVILCLFLLCHFAMIFHYDKQYHIMKWNESGFRPPLCTYRLNWARRTSWGWWDDWDDTVLQTQDSKFEPWRSEAEHATSRSRRLPTILTFTIE